MQVYRRIDRRDGIEMQCCDENKTCGTAPAAAVAVIPASAGSEQAVFLIQKMDCPTEEKLIRDRFGNMSGVVSLQFNLMQRQLTVNHRLPSTLALLQGLKELGLDPVLTADTLDAAAPGMARESVVADFRIPALKWTMMAVSGVAALGSEVVAWTIGNEHAWPVVALALIAVAAGGVDTLRKGWIALRHFSLNMNFLMSLAVIGAAAIGQWPEAAVVIFLFAAAEMIEALSVDRARNAIKQLMAMTPDSATIQDSDGQWIQAPASHVTIGALVRVKPGERLALDGVVTSGQTTINQAPITGESMPVTKQAGDPVFAGTINEQGEIAYRVSASQDGSTLARIVHSVEQAQGDRAPTQRFVDQFARFYIPAVVALALVVGLAVPLLLHAPFQPWLYKALVLLVIACPCALVISTPVTVVSALAAAARHGILVKGGAYLELGRKLKAIALDKTGTITVGRPSVTDERMLAPGDGAAWLRRAASLSARSDHPVSTAVTSFWRAREPGGAMFEVADFAALPGRGISGTIDGQTYYLGNRRLMSELGLRSAELEAALDRFEQGGKSAVVLASPTAPLLIIAVADTIRANSASAIQALRELGVHVVMLTGDNSHTAAAIGTQAGVTDVRGDLLPEDKLGAIHALRAQYGRVGMVGDGINDAPALASADIGFAMGAAGSDTALETADVALMDDDLHKLAAFMRLSARTRAVLLQNIILALSVKAVFLVLALAGHATLWMAVFADMGASLLVVFNGLRMLRDVK
jgi:Cd2+/Zn2+-exporting ATPase